MGRQLGVGVGIGVVVSLMCWRGNQTPHLVSVFPDGATFVVLIALVTAAVWFGQPRQNGMASLRAGLTVATAAGAIHGATVALLGTTQFANPSLAQSAFGFLTALSCSLAVGAAATLMSSRWRHIRTA